MQRIFVWIVFLFAATLAVGSASAIEYGGLGGRPAYPRDDNPRSESIFIHEVQPGQVIEEGVNVINNKETTKTIQVYATDSTPSTDGGFACEQFSQTPDEVGTWIKMSETTVILQPKSTYLVPFSIAVPENADVGEHNGCIMIQEKKENAPTQNMGINLSVRSGMRVLLTVPGDLVRQLDILSFQMKHDKPKIYTLIPEVKNSGNVSIDTDVSVVTKNLIGRTVKEHGGEYSVLRGDTSRWNFEFAKPPFGGYFTSRLTISYYDGEDEVTLSTAPLRFFAWPDPIVMIGMGILSLALIIMIATLTAWFIINKRQLSQWAEYEVKPGDTLADIAEKRNVSWKKLAKVNKLKAPYALSPGQSIRVPPKNA